MLFVDRPIGNCWFFLKSRSHCLCAPSGVIQLLLGRFLLSLWHIPLLGILFELS